MTATHPLDPKVLANLERLARTELSFRVRMGYVLLVLVASAMTIVVVSLWLTEPALPARTQTAFGVLAAIGLSWVAYGLWVLRARRVMLAQQRVVAGRMATLFSAAFLAGTLLLALTTMPAAWPAAAMALAMLGVAVVVWRRAVANLTALRARRVALEQAPSRPAR